MTNIDPRLDDFAKAADQSVGNKNNAFLDTDEERREVLKKARDAQIADEQIQAYFAGQNIPQESITELFGGSFSQTESSKPESVKLSKDLAKPKQDNVLSYIRNDVVDDFTNLDWDKIAGNIKQKIDNGNTTNPQYYAQLQEQVSDMAGRMKDYLSNHPVKSRDDVKGLYKRMEKELNLQKNDEFREFKLNVLKEFVVIVEQSQMAKENKLVETAYKTLIKTKKDDGQEYTREEAMSLIQNNDPVAINAVKSSDNENIKRIVAETDFDGFKGSYFHDRDGENNSNKTYADKYSPKVGRNGDKYVTNGRSMYTGAIHQVENSTVLKDAEQNVYDAIDTCIGKGLKNSRAVEKAAIEELKSKGQYDKYAKKILRGQLSLAEKMNFDMSRIKAYRKSIVIDDRAAARKEQPYTSEEFYDLLKNNKLFDRMVSEAHLIEPARDEEGNILRDENGEASSYNISALSNAIRKKLGADGMASGQSKDLYPYDEVQNIVKEIAVEAGLKDVSTSDVKQLIKFCGFEVIGKNWVKIAWNTLTDTIISAAGPAAALGMVGVEATAAYTGNLGSGVYSAQFKFDEDIPISVTVDKSQNVVVSILADSPISLDKESLFMNLDESLWDFVNIEESATGAIITINRELVEQYSDSFKISDLLSEEELTQEFEVSADELGLKVDDKDIEKKAKKKKAMQAMVVATLVNLAMHFLQNVLSNQDGEKPFINTQFDNMPLDKYLATIDVDQNIKDAEKPAVKALAQSFVKVDENGQPIKDENGKLVWDCEAYKAFLNSGDFAHNTNTDSSNSMAGDASFLSRNEFFTGIRKKLNNTSTPTPPVKKPEPTPQGGSVNVTKTEVEAPAAEKFDGEYWDPEDTYITYTLQKGDTFGAVIAAYYDVDKLKAEAKEHGFVDKHGNGLYTVYAKWLMAHENGELNKDLFKGYRDGSIQMNIIDLPITLGNVPRKAPDAIRKEDYTVQNNAKVQSRRGGIQSHTDGGAQVTGGAAGSSREDAVSRTNTDRTSQGKSQIKTDEVNWRRRGS